MKNTIEKQKKESGTITRKILFNNYRNLGIKTPQSLTLNSRADKDSIGELIIVIGGNNIGKTNVLDGILALNNGIDTDRDAPDFIYGESCEPSVKIVLSNGKTWGYSVDSKGQTVFENKTPIPSKPVPKAVEYKMSQELANHFQQYSRQHHYGHNNNILADAKNAMDKMALLTNEIQQKLIQHINNLLGIGSDYSLKLIAEIDRYQKDIKEYKSAVTESKNYQKIVDEMNQRVTDEAGIPLVPNIIPYKEENISQSDMTVKISNLAKSKFFTKLFKLLDIKCEDILTCCERVNANKMGNAALDNIQKDMNIKLKAFTKQFNKMYTFDDKEYSFAFRLETKNYCSQYHMAPQH